MSNDESSELIVPAQIYAEMEIIGGIIVDNSLAPQAVMALEPADFFLNTHKEIFKVIIEMFKRGDPIDIVTLAGELNKHLVLERIGGMAYLAELITGRLRTPSYPKYISLVREAAARRDLIKSSNRAIQGALDTGEELGDVLTRADEEISGISAKNAPAVNADLSQLVHDRIKRLEAIAAQSKEVTGVTSGLKDLDRMTNGFQPSDLIVIAARPSVGKSALALSIAENVARSGKRVVFFSLEMSKESLTDRMICSIAKVDLHRYRGGFLNKEEMAKVYAAGEEIEGFDNRIILNDRSGISVLDMHSGVVSLGLELRVDIIIVDYLQLIRAHGRPESRTQEVSQIARDLKALAKDLNLPVIALSQLSRSIENRSSRRPQLSDLRESGEIEQSADVVLFIHREEVYEPTEENFGKADIIIGKQRNGPTETVPVGFVKWFTKFVNLYEEGE